MGEDCGKDLSLDRIILRLRSGSLKTESRREQEARVGRGVKSLRKNYKVSAL